MGSKINNDSIVNANTQRIGAMQKYVTSAKTEIPVGGTVLKPADVIAVFQEDLDNRKEVTATRAAYSAAVANRAASALKRQVTDEALKGWVLNRFGELSTEAKVFGYAPRKRPAVTAEKRANAVLLNKATRKARGTVGPKKKLEIKGTLAAPEPVAPAAAANGAVNGAVNGSAHS